MRMKERCSSNESFDFKFSTTQSTGDIETKSSGEVKEISNGGNISGNAEEIFVIFELIIEIIQRFKFY